MSKLIFGCGYLGHRVAKLWQSQGYKVTVVTRTPEKCGVFAQQGFFPILADITQPASLAPIQQLGDVSTVLFSVGWDRTTGQQQRQVYVEGLSHVLAALPPIERFIYISSTGVYGQCEGDWVDETTPAIPVREGGKACLDAENILKKHGIGMKSVVLRLAGIYGPGRIPRAESIRVGEPIAALSQGYLNLIHVDDAARIVLLVEECQKTGDLYVVSDGEPVLRADYYAELARLLDAPPPIFEAPPSNSPAALRAASDKRISPQKMHRELRPALLYPNYRAGLAAIVRDL